MRSQRGESPMTTLRRSRPSWMNRLISLECSERHWVAESMAKTSNQVSWSRRGVFGGSGLLTTLISIAFILRFHSDPTFDLMVDQVPTGESPPACAPGMEVSDGGLNGEGRSGPSQGERAVNRRSTDGGADQLRGHHGSARPQSAGRRRYGHPPHGTRSAAASRAHPALSPGPRLRLTGSPPGVSGREGGGARLATDECLRTKP